MIGAGPAHDPVEATDVLKGKLVVEDHEGKGAAGKVAAGHEGRGAAGKVAAGHAGQEATGARGAVAYGKVVAGAVAYGKAAADHEVAGHAAGHEAAGNGAAGTLRALGQGILPACIASHSARVIGGIFPTGWDAGSVEGKAGRVVATGKAGEIGAKSVGLKFWVTQGVDTVAGGT